MRNLMRILACALALIFTFTVTVIQAQEPSTFTRILTDFELDLDCKPICWKDFTPGETSMEAVYEWFNAVTPTQVSDYNRDTHSVDNIAGFTRGPITIGAFSDGTSPGPLLRAIYLGLPLWVGNGEFRDVYMTPDEARAWLPSGVIDSYGTPSLIAFDPEFDFYQLILDFDEYNTVVYYHGRTITNEAEETIICPQQFMTNHQMWVYSDNETNGLTLIQDLQEYEHFDRLAVRLTNEMQVTEDTYQIAALMDELEETGCFPTVLPDSSIPTPDDLRALVTNCVIDKGIQTSLNAKINAGSWGAFINEVEALDEKKFSSDCAAEMIEMAQYFIDNPPE